jgi:hypothetical protein
LQVGHDDDLSSDQFFGGVFRGDAGDDRALVIARPQTGWGTQRYDNTSAINIPLPAGETWLPLHADGTLGAPVTTVELRNAEAAILIEQRTI